MSPSDETPTSLLLHHIRRVLKKVVCDLPRVKAIESESRKHVESLVNLLGQRHSVLQVSFDWNICSFTDIQTKLLVKISAEVDSKVAVLKEIILPLKEQHNVLNRSRTETLSLLNKHDTDLDTAAMCLGSPLVPPVEVMLRWINELEFQLRELYYSRFLCLENIMDPEIVKHSNLAEVWGQSSDLLATMQDCEEQTRFFLETVG